jgi:hypothetical protein
MKKLIIALMSSIAISSVQAQELSVIGHGFSKHLDNHNFRERNYGIGLRLETDDFGMQVGNYNNSNRRNSTYFGVDWSPYKTKLTGCLNLEAGPYYGVATGYKYDVTPMIGLQSSIKCDNVFARVRLMPDPFYNSKAVGAIEIGVVLKKF